MGTRISTTDVGDFHTVLNNLDPQAGAGNWQRFPHSHIGSVIDAAKEWRKELQGIDRPWLCWCVEDEWCVLQQRLVKTCGWTPVVGTDGRVQSPTVLNGSLYIDFNATLQLPVMWMHFPLEFMFTFCKRLAFWHSDVLPPVSVMQQLAREFETIQPGEYIGVFEPPGGQQRLKRLWKGISRPSLYWLKNWNAKRWFEVIGCTTAAASQSQFDAGCGFWRHIECHPNASQKMRQSTPHYDHGVGIWYWQHQHRGQTRTVTIDIDKYHYTTKGRLRVNSSVGAAEKGQELAKAYDLKHIADNLGLKQPNAALQ